ncbi:MAG: hypothetical protein IPL29_03840 [Propionivibrio sp.]|nr:hypothetical protein [Propionivibrio sp.]
MIAATTPLWNDRHRYEWNSPWQRTSKKPQLTLSKRLGHGETGTSMQIKMSTLHRKTKIGKQTRNKTNDLR